MDLEQLPDVLTLNFVLLQVRDGVHAARAEARRRRHCRQEALLCHVGRKGCL